MRPERMEETDEEDTAFGLPANVVDQKPGLDLEVAKQEVGTGRDRRLRPREEKDIPQESLAARIGKIRKRG
jgi:hypothetical protein